MTIFELLRKLREQSIDEFDKGQRFERLVKAYLKIDPGWTEVFEEIWLWREFPDRPNDQDVGIDLVAKEKETGNLWAIQCKFYDEDTYLDKQHLGTFFAELGKNAYSAGLIVTTSNNWSNFAEQALKDQTKPVQRISLSDLDASPIDWASFRPGKPDALQRTSKKVLRDHQMKALEAVKAGFEVEDRGKLIMACGTGKTFTSLKIAEEMLPAKGLVLFLVPSISLLSQSLREWTAETSRDLKSFAVCSDSKVGKNKNELEDIHSFDLAYPATTNTTKLVENFAIHTKGFNGLEVVFSTYQSLDVIAQAQREGLPEFDLIICDEAHRTTGATLSGEDESSFVRIHDKSYVKGVKRLYMTATPRVYADQAKAKAEENDAVLASMDDETLYGPEFHRLMFGEAVGLGLLSDYKVVVLTVPEDRVATLMAGGRGSALDLPLDDVARIIGCYNGLSKRSGTDVDFAADPAPMMRAVAFARSIKDSKAFAVALPGVVNSLLLDESDSESLRTTAHHVDGTFNVLRRNHELEWLKAPGRPGEVRVLSNARCLAEGVDVPALDAVLFLNPRNSVVDVVQSVGRVMRKNEGKQYGYIIIPIAVPDFEDPKRALDENKRFKTVWQVLQALRSHDERFSAMVNKIDLNKKLDEHLIFAGDDVVADENVGTEDKAKQLVFSMMDSEAWRDVVLAKLVSKVGERTYWEDWANDVALIAGRHVTRIKAILDNPNSEASKKFDQFLLGLRANLNNSITSDDAIEMLSQHLITKPVFDALFSDYSFAEHNPVSIVMQEMVEALDEQGLETESESLEKFYESVRMRVQGIDNAEGRQRIITELYEKFFRGAFKKTTESLGIVYTPIEIVDFIIASVETALEQEFGASMSDEGVHILDPFTGTGTFIVRLLQSGAITSDALIRKYTSELHANEIVLLAYYIAAINIEAVFHEIAKGQYKPFEGIVLTDTFQMAEVRPTDDIFFPDNNARARRQRDIDIRVIVGNPPYSVGQTSQNDNNRNLAYPTLDGRIESTYAAQSSAGLVRNLYDSYIRAFRWASDRIGDSGVICFVSNGAYIDSGSADGFRKTLATEFSSIYCLNLRGNQRTAGETSRREGGKIFGGGSRTPIAITLLIRNPKNLGSCRLHYHDIGDYLSREEKLAKVAKFRSTAGIKWEDLTPDESGDWINQRSAIFETFAPLGDKKDSRTTPIFGKDYSLGVVTSRDAWAHNFSYDVVAENVERTITFYNGQVEAFKESRRGIPSKAGSQDVDAFVDNDHTKISWSANLKNDLRLGKLAAFDLLKIVKSAYRPFAKQWLYFDRQWNERVLLFPRIYPDSSVSNLTIAVSGMGSGAGYSVLMTDEIPSLTLPGAGNAVQCFPLYVYDQVVEENGGSLFSQQDMGDASIFKTPKVTYRRRNAITDTTLAEYRHKIGQEVTKEDIFYYVYGVLHSPEYTTRFAAELGKMIPRIPISTNFWEFSKAGRSLSDLHLNYETVQPWSLDGMPADSARASELRVEKMRFPRNGTEKDRSKIIVNSRITLSGIPDEAYDYMVNGKSAIEWIIDRYQVKTDKDSGIVNDPNLWSDDPRYIVDLVARIVRVSVESAVIISNLPQLRI